MIGLVEISLKKRSCPLRDHSGKTPPLLETRHFPALFRKARTWIWQVTIPARTGVPTLTKTAAASPGPEHARSSRVWFDEMHYFLRFLSLGVFYFQTDLHVAGLAHIGDVAV